MTSTLLATGDDPFTDHVWLPVWVVLAALIVVGAVVWYFAQPDRKDAGGEALVAAFVGPTFAFFWPLLIVCGMFAGFIWSLYRLRLRLYPRLKIPDTDLRVKFPMDEDAYVEGDEEFGECGVKQPGTRPVQGPGRP